MKEQKKGKDQFVIAYITDFDNCIPVINYAKELARVINKGLILLYICDSKYSDIQTDSAEQRLKAMCSEINSAKASMHTSYCTLCGKTSEIITMLPNLLNAVAIVAEVDENAKRSDPRNKRQILKNFAECKTAYIAVPKDLNEAPTYRNIALTIDFKRESKEKLLWASYFARFNNSSVYVLYQDYKDEFLRNKWYDNMKFLYKLFNDLNIKFIPTPMSGESTYPDTNALEQKDTPQLDLMISVTTKDRDLAEIITGVQENKTIVNSAHIPILFLNPRKDLYVLCD